MIHNPIALGPGGSGWVACFCIPEKEHVDQAPVVVWAVVETWDTERVSSKYRTEKRIQGNKVVGMISTDTGLESPEEMDSFLGYMRSDDNPGDQAWWTVFQDMVVRYGREHECD
jgi:hypothetical protein